MSYEGPIDAEAWLARWDRAHALYMPGRASMVDAVLEIVTAAAGGGDTVRVLDLAGGPGSMALAVATRIPQAEVTLLDVDPVLLALASLTVERRALGERIVTVAGDLTSPDWLGVAGGPFDVVVVVMALHWFGPDRLRAIYTEARRALRPGGALVNADRIPDGGLDQLTARIDGDRRARRQRRVEGGVDDWASWWSALGREPSMASLLAVRDAAMASIPRSAEFHPDVAWHLDALHAAGFIEAGVIWRHAADAAVVAVR